jgi:hypothetical protein
VGALGCGSSRGTATLSGAVTATVSLDAVQGFVFLGASNWQLVLLADSGAQYLKFAVASPGTAVPTGTFTDATPNSATGMLQSPDSAAPDVGHQDVFWTNFPAASPEDEGSFMLNILSSGDPTNDGASGNIWNACHGNLTATMEPAQGYNGPAGAGSVSLSATF